MIDSNGRTIYTCTIIDTGGPGPIFRVYPEDDPSTLIERDSASGAWVVVCAAVNKVRGIEREKVSSHSIDLFASCALLRFIYDLISVWPQSSTVGVRVR